MILQCFNCGLEYETFSANWFPCPVCNSHETEDEGDEEYIEDEEL